MNELSSYFNGNLADHAWREVTTRTSSTAADSAASGASSSRARSSSTSFESIFSDFLTKQEPATRETTTGNPSAGRGRTFVTGSNGEPIDLDARYADTPQPITGDLLDAPLLLPTAGTVEALMEHSSVRFKEMLLSYDIPTAPESISFDREGKLVLPEDYPYAEELTQALEENPGLARELHDTHALASHYAEIKRREPMMQELAAARTQAEIDAIMAKYGYLLGDSRSYSQVALTFSESGEMGLSADGNHVDVG